MTCYTTNYTVLVLLYCVISCVLLQNEEIAFVNLVVDVEQ